MKVNIRAPGERQSAAGRSPGLGQDPGGQEFAKSLGAGLSRIQFTPDLLPSDITGTGVSHSEGGKELLQFQPGPIFNNLILADEINRGAAKVQAALLEAMQERQVTVAGKTHKMPDLFMILATQNPNEQEGTYLLPEAQMDRFLMHVQVEYPSDDGELEIIRLVRGEKRSKVEKSRRCRVSRKTRFSRPGQNFKRRTLQKM